MRKEDRQGNRDTGSETERNGGRERIAGETGQEREKKAVRKETDMQEGGKE